MQTQAHGGIEAVDRIHRAAASRVDVAAALAHRAIDRSAHTLHAVTRSRAANSPTRCELHVTARNAIDTSLRAQALRTLALAALAGFLLARVAGR